MNWSCFAFILNGSRSVYLNIGTLTFAFISFISFLSAQNDSFITTWKTNNAGTSDSTSITIPVDANYTYNYDVDWNNDGVYETTGVTGSVSHDFKSTGTYTIRIRGEYPAIYFNNEGDNEKILSVDQWGDIEWKSFTSAFYGATNLTVPASDAPDLSDVTSFIQIFKEAKEFNGSIGHWDVSNIQSMHSAFMGANSFNQDIGGWDVSKVTSMRFMFSGAKSFNQDIGGWDVGNVTDMTSMFNFSISFDQDIGQWDVSNVTDIRWMFQSAESFNQDIGNWDVAKVTKMSAMFSQAQSFDQDIGGWDVSNVTNMESMFSHTQSFNQDIRGWDVAKVTKMSAMFSQAQSFNQDIGGWDVSNVTNMGSMFFNAISFNQDIGQWDVANVSDMTNMLRLCGMTTKNYDKILIGWNTLGISDVVLGALGLTYCEGDAARSEMISRGWEITGDVLACPLPFVTTWKTNNPGTSDSTSITIPVDTTLTYNYEVDWNNDGVYDITGVTGSVTHDFESAGIYTIRIRGDFPAIYFNIEGDQEKILSVDHWGDIEWQSFRSAFYGATNLTVPASDAPDLSGVSSFLQIFRGASKFNGSIGHWDVSNIEYMYSAFAGAASFNQNLRGWDVSNVTKMRSMFTGAESFDQDIGGWDVSNVTDMSFMFYNAASFNQDLNEWDVSNIEYMYSAFERAASFNQNLSEWDVSNVTDMNEMFRGAASFNQDLSKWDVGNVTDMDGMFWDAESFNRDIGQWDVGNVTDMSSMFRNAESFNHDIGGWDVSNVTTMRNMFFGAKSFNQEISEWDVGNVTDMGGMFWDAETFNGDIGQWDVGNVTDMGFMFRGAASFNQDIGGWDVSKVVEMNRMFSDAESFNQDIGGWDVSNVIGMAYMFQSTASFNQDIGGWDVSNVTGMIYMFSDATLFNQDIGGWDVSNVIGIRSMFQSAASFNQDIGGWDVSNVTTMRNMFASAISFNQDLESWDISSVDEMTLMLDSSGMSTENYDQTLIGWNKYGTSDVVLGASELTYCDGDAARSEMISRGWEITGDVLECSLPFITTWKTNNPGTSDSTSITIPVDTTLTYNYEVDWNNDGVYEATGVTGSMTHDFESTGTYTIRIRGEFPAIYFNNEGDKDKILSVEQWGDIEWKSFSNAFYGATNLTVPASDAPDLSGVSSFRQIFRGASTFNSSIGHWDVSNILSMRSAFSDATSFNQDIGGWNVSNVTSMFFTFARAESFNQDIGTWDVSNVTDMSGVFTDAESFNQDIGTWDVSKVIRMAFMFENAKAFNQDIGGWDVSNLTEMSAMFRDAESFDQDLGSWDVSKVKYMGSMFRGAKSFNQDIGGWDVSNVTRMGSMFFDASSFDQNIGEWAVSNVTVMENMLNGCGMNTENYDKTLIGWNTLGTSDVVLGASGLTYCESETARSEMISRGWEITGDGLECPLTCENVADAGQDASYCYDADFIDICAVEQDQAQYTWAMGSTVLEGRCADLMEGQWILTVSDSAGCSDVDTVDISKFDIIEVELSEDSTVNVTGGTAPYVTDITQSGGGLIAKVTDANGCTGQDSLITTSVNNRASSTVNVYPNPVRDNLIIDAEGYDSYDVVLFDQYGRKVIHQKNAKELDVSSFNPGLYYLKLFSSDVGTRVQHFPVVIMR